MTDTINLPFGDLTSTDIDDLLNQDKTLLKICAVRNDVPPFVLARLASHRDELVREAVASNESAPADVLKVLAGDESAKVRLAVAANPSTPGSILGKMVESGRGLESRAATRNPSTPLISLLYRMLSSVSEDEKAALGFNVRFEKLLRYARELDDAEETMFVDAPASPSVVLQTDEWS